MKVPLRWLAEWIDLPPRDVLEERLTMGGLEIEDVIHTGPALEGLLVGRVLSREAHPQADRLSRCTVDVGADEPVDVVCGAPNVAAGQAVAVALHGATLPDGTRIKRSKIRGVVSNGMICSARELGMGDDHEGILVLDTELPPGAPLARALDAGDTVLDLEITPNRGDWVSLLGLAREVRAHFGGTLRIPPAEPPEGERDAAGDVALEVRDRAGCHRYVARVVRDLRVGPSPDWLRERLEAAGFRSVNDVVDVTNLVMLELGQPLHAFDLDKLHGGCVRVRSAEPGEKLRTLDGHLRELAAGDLVIADAEGAVAIAGVMGSAESEVDEATRHVLLESAHFAPDRVRRTAKRLGLQSDASYRFERGVDPEGVRRAADRAARLLAEVAGGRVSRGVVEARGEPPPRTEEIFLDADRTNRLLGTELSVQEMKALLARVDVEAHLGDEGLLRCRPPSWRSDLHLPADLVEEIARIHGYDRIPETLPVARLAGVTAPPERAVREAVRDSLAASGLTEVMTFPGVPAADADALDLPADDPRRRAVALANPIQSSDATLRTTLVPSVLRVGRANLARQVERLALFELSRVFRAGTPGALPDEPLEAVALLCEGGSGGLWEPRDVPVFFRAKGVAERLFRDLAQPVAFRAGSAAPYLHPGAAGTFVRDELPVAAVGELHPDVAARFEIGVPAALVVVDVAALQALPPQPPRHRDVSNQPQVRRDLAILVGRDVPAGDILAAIRTRGGPALVSAEIFDRYEGRGVPEGRVSLAFRLVFQRPDRTLTDAEVAKATDRVVQMVEERFGGELR